MLHLLVIVKLTGTFEQLKVSQEATIDMSHGHGIYIKRSISSLRQASKCYPRNHTFSFRFTFSMFGISYCFLSTLNCMN